MSSCWEKLLGPSLGDDDASSPDDEHLCVRDPKMLNLPQPDSTEFDYPMMSIEDAKVVAKAMTKESLHRKEVAEMRSTTNQNAYDEESLERHLNRIKYEQANGIKRVPWIETLSLTLNESVDEKDSDNNDDILIETRFHDLTAIGVVECLKRLEIIQVPFTRPPDCYAEMLKSDHQMHKVKRKIEIEKSKISAVEKRKKLRIEKKYSKKVQAEKIKEKQQQKNKNLEKIEKWKQSSFKTKL